MKRIPASQKIRKELEELLNNGYDFKQNCCKQSNVTEILYKEFEEFQNRDLSGFIV